MAIEKDSEGRPLRPLAAVRKSFSNYTTDQGAEARIQHQRELHLLTMGLIHQFQLEEAYPRAEVEAKVALAAKGEDGKGNLDMGFNDFAMWFFREFGFSDQAIPEAVVDEAEFEAEMDMDSKELRLFIASWNVGNEQPNGCAGLLPRSGGQYDVIAVGVQECDYKAKYPHKAEEPPHEAKVFATGATRKLHDWFGQLVAHLGRGWVIALCQELGQMRLVVFARNKVAKHLRNLECATEATGVGHLINNKGGIVIRFDIFGSSIAFVSAHLAAHEGGKHLERRNGDCCEILSGARVGPAGSQYDVLSQTDHVFWMGDLNYRLNLSTAGLAPPLPKGASKEELAKAQYGIVMERILAGNLEELWPADELHLEVAAGRVLTGFTEGVYDFPPTFKVVRHETANVWQDIRTPSWCDRILWKSKPSLEGHAAPDIWFENLRGKASSTGGQTSIIMNSLSPEWEDSDIPLLRSMLHSPEQLAESSMLLAFWDHDVADPDDLMGTAWVSLKQAVGSGGYYDFDEQVVLNGQAKGRVQGRVKVVWPDKSGKRESRSFERRKKGGGCECTVL